MTVVERQVHGYRQGHQLLAASAQLPKEDQSVVDRLSDVAGPLRPRERFESYLTAYPLPSGQSFVVARTWQDLTVARAGCVRTLSLIIPIKDWAEAEGLSGYDQAAFCFQALLLNFKILVDRTNPGVADFRHVSPQALGLMVTCHK